MARLLSVNKCKSEDVYDLVIKKNHNFFANGVLVHNCGEWSCLSIKIAELNGDAEMRIRTEGRYYDGQGQSIEDEIILPRGRDMFHKTWKDMPNNGEQNPLNYKIKNL